MECLYNENQRVEKFVSDLQRLQRVLSVPDEVYWSMGISMVREGSPISNKTCSIMVYKISQ